MVSKLLGKQSRGVSPLQVRVLSLPLGLGLQTDGQIPGEYSHNDYMVRLHLFPPFSSITVLLINGKSALRGLHRWHTLVAKCSISSMVELLPSKQKTGVRFSYAALH